MKKSALVSVIILFWLSVSLGGRAQNVMTNDQAVKAYLSGDQDMKGGPDFGMVDTALKPVSLESLKGKYVLLDKEGRVFDSELTKPSNPETVDYLRSLKGI